jgi:hypothetical protein
MYAGWARRIHLVTDRQVPAWLVSGHPQLRVVDHREIFRDPSVLPVFNSHAIESQLHHIPDLAPQYLYLNDDVFLGRPVEPELFFHGNGISKFFLAREALDIEPLSPQDIPVLSAAKRQRELLTERFGAAPGHKFRHTPHPQLRTVLEQLEAEHAPLFAAVARSRFRHPDDVSIASSWFHWYAYGLGRAVPDDLAYLYQDIARAETRRRLENLLRTRHVDAFCLNDTAGEAADPAEQARLLRWFLEAYFPLASPFER